eukprot:Protomagalhaensia_wolfi_Nauph_80__58@NODE_1035_length_1784_cov_14_093983_g781_i0_p1_GENE_NODE_1035_length_1784_cov_14_093983_g781_i0NODE_1035_length_1784_cov_14_093983_g781_i0_p1_ORF_typecomplete_len505_score79_87REPA_OB_2/PF16900_5/0_47REPA_OB_2/PF16900_5/3_3e16REPA_OB_2/PF16900_5/2_6DUF223/PF02721_14/4_4e09DUF223/PF02721_14/6e02Rep_facA_C/PF08646_10/7_3e09tRNA_anticodon/PF01336_25/2_9e06tRNA_anticodon/PF01336_25/30tRNA_anticodon/PF01336_25/3_6e03POT1PC/PF16686_5/3_6e02POT1PC/PF16686_5/0_014POT
MEKRRSSIPGGLMPIRSLKPFMSKWRIQGRIVEKSSMNTFQGRQGPGKVFNCIIVDNESTAIIAKFWNDAAEKWHDLLEKGKVYTFYKGRIQVSNKKFAGTVDHAYELTLDADTEIIEVTEATDEIPLVRTVQYSSLRCLNMSMKTLPFLTNVLGIVHSYQQTRTATTAQGDRKRKLIHIVDATRHMLDVTLWGDHAEASDSQLDTHPAVSLVNVQIREWNGKVCSTVGSSEIEWSPSSKAAHELKKWYDEHGHGESFQNLGQGLGGAGNPNARPVVDATLKELYDEMESVTDADDIRIFRVQAYVTRLLYTRGTQAICVYPRCSKCGKKVPDSGVCCIDSEVQKGLNLAALLADTSCSELRVTFFHDQAQSLLGVGAVKVDEWIQEGSSRLHPEMIDLFDHSIPWRRYTLTIRAKRDSFRQQFRTNFVVVSAALLSAGTVAAQCMSKCLALVPNIFDTTTAKRLACNQENGTNQAEEDPNPKMRRVHESPRVTDSVGEAVVEN